jgi:hypothetical protein
MLNLLLLHLFTGAVCGLGCRFHALLFPTAVVIFEMIAIVVHLELSVAQGIGIGLGLLACVQAGYAIVSLTRVRGFGVISTTSGSSRST